MRYANIEVVEIDGLEGDDEFFVQSTAFGVAYRVIGGLGSDTINVTGDVTEDVVVRELEGLSGAVNHLVSSDDPLYDGVVVDGIDLNVATPTSGNVIITETGGFTAVREGGPVEIDKYFVRLAADPGIHIVYVTVSAARSSQEEADGLGPSTHKGDTIWVCNAATDAECDNGFAEFRRHLFVNSDTLSDEPQRAVVLKFTGGASGNWNVDQAVYVYAVNDLRSEGTRVVAVSHSVISTDERYDGVLVRNVEVTVRDDDTPGVFVLEVQPGTSIEDNRTVVIEGTATTGLTDELLVQLSAKPVSGTVVVHLKLDEDSEEWITVTAVSDPLNRWNQAARTITFTSADGDWDAPIRLRLTSRDNDRRQDPRTAVIEFEKDASSTAPNYDFPSLYAPPTRVAAEVLDDETAGAAVIESAGSTLVVFGGATDDYFIRLQLQPTAPVEVAILTDGLTDVKSINGVPVVYQEIGGYHATQLFIGSVTLGNDGAGRVVITRTDTGSFLDEGFAPGMFVRISGLGAANGDRYVFAVDESTITLTAIISVSGPASAILSKLVRTGLWEGQVTADAAASAVACAPASSCRQLIRTDSTGWLADGFLEGQRVRVCIAGTATCADFKIALIRGTNATKDEKLQFTSEGAFPFSGAVAVSVTRIAAVATFTGNAADPNAWFKQQRIELVADTLYSLPPGRENVKVFPVSTHVLSKLRGPLAVEGGTTAADRSLRNGVKLAGERDASLFGIPAQPQESSQIDVLNVFNDSSQADGVGTMTSTTLTGFGMSKNLQFGGGTAFGEPATFPGGISFGTIAFVNGQFTTDGAKSTIEVLNVLLGQGNDKLTITGTLDPAPETYTPVTFTGPLSIAPTGGGGSWFNLTRATGSWITAGFIVGQQVLVSDVAGTFRVVGVTAGVLTLERGAGAPALAAATNVVKTVSVPGPHGGLTVVHGGGNHELEVTALAVVGGNAITRSDGLSWLDDGYQVGQLIALDGSATTRTITGFADVACTLADPFARCGKGSRMLVSGASLAAATSVKVSVVDPKRVVATASMTLSANSVTRATGSWLTDGFKAGMEVWISGLPGSWTITSLTAATLTLNGAAIVPAAAATLTVFASDPAFAGPVRIGGDHLVVATPGPVLGGPNSPLVLYGDTSQDGLWYSGNPATIDGYEFGDKPFNPFVFVPDGENEDDEWLFPLGNPFRLAGNDVIDASALFAGLVCNATCSSLPSVGITAYGGDGDDLIIGSQTGDYLAGGSGDDTILGLRGIDQIYGDSGVNVNILTRGADDPLRERGLHLRQCGPATDPRPRQPQRRGRGHDRQRRHRHGDRLRRRHLRRSRRRDAARRRPEPPEPATAEDPDDGLHPRHRDGAAGRRGRRRDPRQHGPRPHLRRQRQRHDHRRRSAEHDLRRPRTHAVHRGHDRRDDTASGREHFPRARRRRPHHRLRRGRLRLRRREGRPDRRGRRPEHRLRRPRPHHWRREQHLQPPDPAPRPRRSRAPSRRTTTTRSRCSRSSSRSSSRSRCRASTAATTASSPASAATRSSAVPVTTPSSATSARRRAGPTTTTSSSAITASSTTSSRPPTACSAPTRQTPRATSTASGRSTARSAWAATTRSRRASTPTTSSSAATATTRSGRAPTATSSSATTRGLPRHLMPTTSARRRSTPCTSSSSA